MKRITSITLLIIGTSLITYSFYSQLVPKFVKHGYPVKNQNLSNSGSYIIPVSHDMLKENVLDNSDPDKIAEVIVKLLKEKDFDTLKTHSSSKGVLFSPYGYINTKTDIVLSGKDLENLDENKKTYNWGIQEGSGAPINMSFNDYYTNYIYDADYINATVKNFGENIQRGNSLNNIEDIFSGAYVVEYYFPGFEKKYEGMDWRSLKLVFQKMDSKWILVALVHGEWTP